MAGLQASEAVSGPFLEPPSLDATSQSQTAAVFDVAGLNLNDAANVLTPTGTRAYLDVSPVTVMPGGFPVLGAEGVYTNGRCKEQVSPRIGSRSRDSSSERSLGGGTTPCGIMKDGSKQRQSRKKTVSFSSMPSDRKMNSTAACMAFMMEGCEMKKVRSNSRMYNRYFVLDADMCWLRWEPSKKDSEKAKLEIKSIKEVRLGKKTPVLRSNGLSDQFPDECAFSIIYGENYESLDLVASTPDVVSTWVMGLRYLVSYGRHTVDAAEASQPSLRTSWIGSVFELADVAKQGHIELLRATQIIKGLNPGMKESRIELKFKELQKAKDEYGEDINADTFVEAYCELCTRPEVFFLMMQFSTNKEHLDSKDLMLFVEVEQGVEGVTEEMCHPIVQKFEPSKEGRERGCLSIDGFTHYLLSPECHIFDPQHKRVCQDMNQPLSHYYINSSHNASLLEDHFWGSSDISSYIRALRMGCRSLEMVVWDGPDCEPVVYVGSSVASQLAFCKVLDVVNQYAFESSEYPLILCLVVHCCVPQQRAMAQHMKKILGDKLYVEPPNPEEHYLPSPEKLKGRILLKGKRLPPNYPDSEGDVTDEEEGLEMSRRLVGADEKDNLNGIGCKRLRLYKELSDLVSLCKSVQFRDFETSKREQRHWEMCSFNEVDANRFANEFPEDFVGYNKRFLSRVYPTPMRIDASNMNPQDFWKCGCQIVAMNYQTPGLMMDLNLGWFRQNGNCGYVLRPAIMREEVSYFSANARDSLPGVSAQLLHIKVISGQNLPKPRGSAAKGDVVEPYIYVEIHGIPADCAEQRTKTVSQNGDNPIFDESFEFQINLPELAALRFVVLDDDYIGDEFIGQYTIPFECLQPGYRHVPLQSLTGEFLPNTTLFVHVAITNRRGGGKAHKRGLSVRKGRKTREYTSTKTTGIKVVDELFRASTQPLREATDLRENVQNAMVSFKELCGLAPAANMKQCIMTVSSWLLNSERSLRVAVDLSETYPTMEAQGPVPELLRKVLNAYDTMIQTSRTLIESADGVYAKLTQAQRAGLDFHEDLHRIGAKEGLKGRKLQKAMESYAWNITVLKGQADLLKHAKSEAVDTLRQIHCAALSCGLVKNGAAATATPPAPAHATAASSPASPLPSPLLPPPPSPHVLHLPRLAPLHTIPESEAANHDHSAAH
ncbi:inactive phospholipase C-like protein 2 [Clupea harengus]|uniref:Phosphoinositide phospholipase C n=1 Tax=Clupea harengus TaxID=7950 RepID=A0A6P8FFU7_CLUHA|nr:inactive phospholipase C-like protein 2 [Clupea harengus]